MNEVEAGDGLFFFKKTVKRRMKLKRFELCSATRPNESLEMTKFKLFYPHRKIIKRNLEKLLHLMHFLRIL